MTGAERPKSRLGKIALQQRRVAPEPARATEPPAPVLAQLDDMQMSEGLAVRARKAGIAALELSQLAMPLEAVKLIPVDLARDYGMLAIDHSGARAVVAMSAVPNPAQVEEFEFLLGKKVASYLVEEADLQAAISGAYSASVRGESFYRPGRLGAQQSRSMGGVGGVGGVAVGGVAVGGVAVGGVAEVNRRSNGSGEPEEDSQNRHNHAERNQVGTGGNLGEDSRGGLVAAALPDLESVSRAPDLPAADLPATDSLPSEVAGEASDAAGLPTIGAESAPDYAEDAAGHSPSVQAANGDQGLVDDGGVPVARLDAAFSDIPPKMDSHSPEASAGTRLLVGGLSADLLKAFGDIVGSGIILAGQEDSDGLLQALTVAPPDLILLTTALRGLSTLEMCARVRKCETTANVPIVVLSRETRGWRFAADLRAAFGVSHVFEQPSDRVIDLHLVHDGVKCALQGESLNEEPGPVPLSAEPHLRAGMQAFEQGDLDKAISNLENAVAIAPRSFQLQYHLGLLHGRRGDQYPALAALEVAVELQPGHFSALKNLAVVYQRAGFRHQATGTWERAMWNAPDDETRATIKDHMVRLLQ